MGQAPGEGIVGCGTRVEGIPALVSPERGAAVEGAVLDGFGDVVPLDVLRVFEVRDGAGDLEDSVVGAGADAQFVNGHLQDVSPLVVELGDQRVRLR